MPQNLSAFRDEKTVLYRHTSGGGETVHAEMAPFTGPAGEATTLHESIFSTIPGSPAYVSRAEHFRSLVPALGHDVNVQNHNAIQGTFRFVA